MNIRGPLPSLRVLSSKVEAPDHTLKESPRRIGLKNSHIIPAATLVNIPTSRGTSLPIKGTGPPWTNAMFKIRRSDDGAPSSFSGVGFVAPQRIRVLYTVGHVQDKVFGSCSVKNRVGHFVGNRVIANPAAPGSAEFHASSIFCSSFRIHTSNSHLIPPHKCALRR